MKFATTFAAAIAMAFTLSHTASAAESDHAGTASSAIASAMSSGEVKKVDKDAGKITIKHGPLENLGMPAMTMVFHVAEPAMLDQAKAGDKIAFVAEKRNGALTVTKMETVKNN